MKIEESNFDLSCPSIEIERTKKKVIFYNLVKILKSYLCSHYNKIIQNLHNLEI